MQTTQTGRSRPSGTRSQNDHAYGARSLWKSRTIAGSAHPWRAEKAVEVEAVYRQVPEQQKTHQHADQSQRGRVGRGEEEPVPGPGRCPPEERQVSPQIVPKASHGAYSPIRSGVVKNSSASRSTPLRARPCEPLANLLDLGNQMKLAGEHDRRTAGVRLRQVPGVRASPTAPARVTPLGRSGLGVRPEVIGQRQLPLPQQPGKGLLTGKPDRLIRAAVGEVDRRRHHGSRGRVDVVAVRVTLVDHLKIRGEQVGQRTFQKRRRRRRQRPDQDRADVEDQDHRNQPAHPDRPAAARHLPAFALIGLQTTQGPAPHRRPSPPKSPLPGSLSSACPPFLILTPTRPHDQEGLLTWDRGQASSRKFITDSPVVFFSAILTLPGCFRFQPGLEFAVPEQSLQIKSSSWANGDRPIVQMGGSRVAIDHRCLPLACPLRVRPTSSCFAPGGLTCRVRLS